jgi:hypothetical protein
VESIALHAIYPNFSRTFGNKSSASKAESKTQGFVLSSAFLKKSPSTPVIDLLAGDKKFPKNQSVKSIFQINLSISNATTSNSNKNNIELDGDSFLSAFGDDWHRSN